ncbi:hypothetical protein [Lacibacter sp.]|uniref:hypothetical protein n=1 Tax=Lacibacter sp. TaxID=1915409 RepID=UPI002B4AC762|nr:hypothetical protein [Lacibacter sp.]HLP37639.1 hypothetical protein [Lacibacter sp.]
MIRLLHLFLFLGSCNYITAQQAILPLVDSNFISGSKKDVIVVEAEHFYKQTKTDRRAWYINSPLQHPQVWPDHDTASYADASGLAYIEALPDLFHTEEDPIINGENLGSDGNVAVVHYKVFFKEAGRYYLWTRLRSNDEEDNTTQAGINGIWPASAKILQSPVNKKKWIWKSDNRISRNPWKIGRAYLDISSAGIHDVQFGMREDGEEFDKFILTTDSSFTITEEKGPSSTVYNGKLPKPFSLQNVRADIYHAIANPDGAIYGANLLYADTSNVIVFEAEDFYRQTKTETRMWHLVTERHQPVIGPDSDAPHLSNASANAYLELLPDARQKDEDGINSKTSIKGIGGQAAVISYMIEFPAAGKYYVWIRAVNTDGDDNTLHVGINNIWPESGKKMVFGSKQWKWSNTQRDTKAAITIDVPVKGRQELMLSMREDGCEIDKILVTSDSTFRPNESLQYPIKIKKGNIKNWHESRHQQMNTAFLFREQYGELLMECESVPSFPGWLYKADSSGQSGYGYYEWTKTGQGIKPGEGLLKYHFEIATPGNYQLFIRGKMKDAANRLETPDPDGNDVWVKFQSASSALKDTVFHKVAILGHPNGWTWNSNDDITKEHTVTPFLVFLQKGFYTLTLSGRSQGYAIDKILLLNVGKKPFKDFEVNELKNYNNKAESPKRRRHD